MLTNKKFELDLLDFEEFDTVEVDGVRHYNVPGGPFPSVTTILKILDDGKWLDQWRNRIGAEEAAKITSEAAYRGNDLHRYNELYLLNKLDRGDLKGQAKILFNRAKKYLNEIDVVHATEAVLYHDVYRYAGRVDAIGRSGSVLEVIDHKNSRNPIKVEKGYNRRKLFMYMLQVTAYALALERVKGLKAVRGRIIVSNFETSNANRFVFDLEPLKKEFLLVLHAYYNKGEGLKNSMYYKLS